MEPKVSVVLPVYNSEKTIKQTLESILGQSLGDFELIVINDGSTDSGKEIIQSFSDSRIRLLDNDSNRGLIFSLNRGLDAARGKYIARMDSDDIMQPDRLFKQFEFMEKHPDIDICGCACEIINDDNQPLGKLLYWLKNDSIRADLMFNSPLAHPTYFIRSEAIAGYRYNPDFKYCEDYELLSRFLLDGHKAANLPGKLLRYRNSVGSQSQIGERNADQRFALVRSIQKRLIKEALQIENDEYLTKLHYLLSQSNRVRSISLTEFPVSVITKYFKFIEKQIRETGYCSVSGLKPVLGKIWIKLLRYKLRPTMGIRNAFNLVWSRYSLYGIRCLIYRLTKY